MSMAPQKSRYEQDGLLWLLVGAIGFFFGASLITGPLGWYFGNKLKREADDEHAVIPDVLAAARIVGIVTTLLTYIGLIVALVVILFFFGVVGTAAAFH